MLSTKVPFALLILLSSLCSYAQTGTAATPSSTKLSISPRAVNIGEPATLTAKVQLGAAPIRHGSVTFCDANAARCQGLAVLGSAQLTSNGMASVKLSLGAGTYSIKAVFAGTPRTVPPVPGSASATLALTVARGSKTPRQERNRN
jgi:hypothetical protein